MEAILDIKELNKAFGGLQALLDFNLTVHERDLVGIIGPNGAGKTTIFNLITGFIRPNSGEVWLNRREYYPSQALPNRQSGNVPHLPAGGPVQRNEGVGKCNDSLFLKSCQKPAALRGKKPWQVAMGFLEEMGLGDRFNEEVQNLAFGELRLLDIARAMATEPELLLLDEPFSGLDAGDAEMLAAGIKRMHAKGQTMVIIEHRLRDLLRLVERVVALVFGEKIAEGTPDEIMNNDKVVQAYLGKRR